MTDPAPVLVESRDGVMIVTINRPAQRNAVTRAVSLAIAAALDTLDERDDLRVAVLTGAGGSFCSGMDLKAFVAGERPELEGRGFAGVTERSPVKPLIAAVEGFALAGGCELALACDLIVAAENAAFGLPEVSRGLVAGSGGLVRLPRRIPAGIALEYALTGARMAAPDAHRWGLVNRLAASGEALAEALPDEKSYVVVSTTDADPRSGWAMISATGAPTTSRPRMNRSLWSTSRLSLDRKLPICNSTANFANSDG